MLIKRLFHLNKTYLRTRHCRQVSYVQGQEPEPKIREYFYYIDHQGMLFLDDAKMKNFTSCFKEKKFLQFFFKRLKLNDTSRYSAEFPYMSPCGRERNYIRCDDTPIVFTHVLHEDAAVDKLTYAYGGDLLTVDFQPDSIYMNPLTGRVYHPAWEKVGSIGLIRSKLAIELSRNFEFASNTDEEQTVAPTHFLWRGKRLTLKTDWVEQTQRHGMHSETLVL